MGVLFFFTGAHGGETRDYEKFISIFVNISQLYPRGMLQTDKMESVRRSFQRGDINEKDFYTNNKFALWIDLRTHPENEIHGRGRALKDTPDGLKYIRNSQENRRN